MSTGKEAEGLRSPEQYPVSRLTHREVQSLIANNRTTLILNPQSYAEQFGNDGNKFDPAICDPVRIVDVRQYDGSISKGIQDGNHRTFSGELYGRTVDPDIPYLPARNVTQQFSDGPLSPERFMEVLITPTKAHTEIAPERMAYITLTQWEQMVGPKIASKYSILAALTGATRLDPYFVGSTAEERELLEIKLEALDETIRKTDYLPKELRTEILDLMSKQGDDAVLEEHMRRQQIEGLLLLPAVHQKFIKVFDETASGMETARESFVTQVSRSITEFTGLKGASERETIMETIIRPILPYRETVQIITAPSPKSAEKNHTTIERVVKIHSAYQATLSPGEAVSANARSLLSKFKERKETPEEIATTIVGVVKTLDAADTAIALLPQSDERHEIERLRTQVRMRSTYDNIKASELKLQAAIQAAHAAAERKKEEQGTDKTEQIRTLTAENSRLTGQVRTLEAENERLITRERTLEEEVARLQKLLEGRTDTESTKPSETVLVNLSPVAASEPPADLPTEEKPPEPKKTAAKKAAQKTVVTTPSSLAFLAPNLAAATKEEPVIVTTTDTSTTVFMGTTPDSPAPETTEVVKTEVVESVWKTRTYNRETEGTKTWFGQHFASGKEVDEETRQKTTLMIDRHARMLLRYPPDEWDDTLSDIQLKTGQRGLDAIDHALTPRFGRLIHDVAWGTTNDEFSYLAAASIIRFLKASEEDITATDPRRAYNMQQTADIMKDDLHKFKPAMFDGNRKAYAALIQVLLLGHPQDEARATIIKSMRGTRMDTFSARNKLAQLVEIQDPSIKHPEASEKILGELFRRHILGERPPISAPDPDTFQ